MKKIELKAPAKINLFLDVTGKNDCGYHNIKSIMQTVNLYDYISIRADKGFGVNLTCNILKLQNEENLVYKAAKLLQERFCIEYKIDISLQKNIPYKAGLAGGSSDLTMTVLGMNSLFNLGLKDFEIVDILKKISKDSVFFLTRGTALVMGDGRFVKALPALDLGYFIIVKPDIGINTSEAYKKIDEAGLFNNYDIYEIEEAIIKKDIIKISESMRNIFEEVCPKEILKIKEDLKDEGAIGSLMTGSGSAVFGIFPDKESLDIAKLKLSKKYVQVYSCMPVRR